MKNRRIHCAIAAITLGTPCVVFASGATDRLASQADAVVVAEAQAGAQTGPAASLSLSIVRVLKGPLQAGDAAAVSWTSGFSVSRDLTGSYGLWLLKKRADGNWYLLPLANGPVPIESTYLQLAKGATNPAVSGAGAGPAALGDLMAVEIAGSMPQHASTMQLFGMATALLGIAETPTTLAVLRSLQASSDQELHFVGLAGLIGTDYWSPLSGVGGSPDPSRLAEARSVLSEIAGSVDALSRQKVSPGLVGHALAVVRDTDPGSIAALAMIALSQDQGLQTQAALALECIHTRDTLPILAQLLDSPYPMVRESAILGMGRFVNNLPVTTNDLVPNQKYRTPMGPAPYRTAQTDKYSQSSLQVVQANEAEYVQFWKSWWAGVKSNLAP